MKIKVNTLLCGACFDCRLCLDLCPQRVFGVRPRLRNDPHSSARNWVISPVMPSRCSGCKDCLTFCPQQAISIN